MSQPIRGQGSHLVFLIGPKNTNLVEEVEIFLSVKFCWILFCGFRGEVENISANQRLGRPSWFFFSIDPKNPNLVVDDKISLPFKFCSAVSEQKSKMFQTIRDQGGHLVFPISPKNTNLVDDVAILLPVKFRWIPFSGFREVENVSANQMPGQPSCFFDRPENTNLVDDFKMLLPVKFRWIPFSGFRGEAENVKS